MCSNSILGSCNSSRSTRAMIWQRAPPESERSCTRRALSCHWRDPPEAPRGSWIILDLGATHRHQTPNTKLHLWQLRKNHHSPTWQNCGYPAHPSIFSLSMAKTEPFTYRPFGFAQKRGADLSTLRLLWAACVVGIRILSPFLGPTNQSIYH